MSIFKFVLALVKRWAYAPNLGEGSYSVALRVRHGHSDGEEARASLNL